MKASGILAMIGNIKEKSNHFLIAEMEAEGHKGLVPSHGVVLYYLFEHPDGLPMKRLAELARRKKNTVTVLVEKLIKLGYVTRERDLQDARVHLIRLTEKGRQFKAIFWSISEKLYEKMYKGIGEGDIGKLFKILNVIESNM